MYYGVMLGPSRRVSRRQREPRYALSFDGVDDYGDLGISRIHYDGGSVGLFADESETWTVEFWARPLERNWNILGFARAAGSNQTSILKIEITSRLYIYLRGGGGSFDLSQTLNVWTHYAIRWSGSDATIIQNASDPVPLSVGEAADRDYPILVGARLGSGSQPTNFFNGLKRDMRIWNYARTHEEIVNNMHRKLTGTEPGLIGYWPCDEGHGAIAHDLTAQQNHMMLHGVTWVEV